jgi:hypothetical protein
MPNHLLRATFVALLFASGPQNRPEPQAAISMPLDRVNDSYAIYSQLMPVGETASKNLPHKLWLVADTTVQMDPGDRTCKGWLNANPTVTFPKDHMQDFKEIMADFDLHCQDRVLLKHDDWNVPIPVLLLSESEQNEYRRTWGGKRKDNPAAADVAKKYEGAPGIFSFSEVFFNAHHTIAVVYASQYCGGMCGDGQWHAFALETGEWKRLPWGSTYMIV